MRSSFLKLYAPFIALAALQGLFMAVAPSTGPDAGNNALTQLESGTSLGQGDLQLDESGNLVDSQGNIVATAEQVAAGEVPGISSGGSTSGTATSGGGGGGGGGGESAAASQGGDTSHCTKDGRQHGVTYHAPKCIPKWPDGADNGGATYQGVTDKEILVVSFREQANEQVSRLLAAEGLSQTPEDDRLMQEAAVEFINKHYELYGRKLKVVQVTGDCPQTPPDPAKCKQAAQEVVKMRPFMVMWRTPLYAEVFDIWAREGIIALGGWHFADRYFNDRRPLRWDLNMAGFQSADVLAEYYCKKMAGKGASHSGRVIHADVGPRGTPRVLGIVTPELPANVETAQRVAAKVRDCEKGRYTPKVRTYVSDINRAEEQSRTITAGLIEDGVTTVLCMCDPIAPIFGTRRYTEQRYFPEIFISGMGYVDFDKVGRLYDSAQMEHAFGVSHIAQPIPHGETDATKVWRDVGYHEKTGQATPCQSCNLNWGYFSIVASMLHYAGPNLNPLTVERGMFAAGPRGGWGETGGRPEIVLTSFAPNDYTALSDFREIYWSKSHTSPIDGRPGGYVGTNGGRRYRLGELQGDLSTIPVPAS